MGIKSTFSVINRVISDIILRRIDDRYVISTKDVINITGFDFDKKCVYLRPHKQLPLYCISILSSGNMPQSVHYLENIIETYSADEDSRLFCFYTKSNFSFDETYSDFATKQNLYIFSHSKILLEEIGDYFSAELLEPLKIFNAILDIGLNSQYSNDIITLDVQSIMGTIKLEIDDMAVYFKTLFAEGVYNAISETPDSSFQAYQGVGHNGFMGVGKPDIIGVLSSTWRGYLNINLELSSRKTRNIVEFQKRVVSFVDPDEEVRNGYRRMYDEVEKNPSQYVIANIVFVTDNARTVQKVSDSLNINFIKKRIFSKNILYKTPILSRDGDYDFPMHASFAKNYIQNVIRRNDIVAVRPPMLQGRDVVGNYTTFNPYESPAPHTGVIAKTRSGKTYFVLSLISGALRCTIELNPYYIKDNRNSLKNSPVIIRNANRLGSEVEIVHFDVGYSGEKYVHQLQKTYPSKVHINSDNLNDLRFGLTDVKTIKKGNKLVVDKTDALFLSKTISTLLRLNGEEPLTSHESSSIMDKLAQLFSEKSFKTLIIGKLKEIGGYEKVLADIEEYLERKLDDYEAISDLNLPEKFSFMNVPILSDIIRLLENTANSIRIDKEEKKVWQSAALKLKSLSEDQMYAYYNRVRIPNVSYFYMELETLKKMGDNVLIPIYLMLFQQLYRLKLSNAQYEKNNSRTTKEVIFILEELHNFTKIPELRDLINSATLEAARYGIVFIFISQNSEHFPESLLLNLGNRVVMPAPKEELEMQISELPLFWKTDGDANSDNNEDSIRFFKKYSKRFHAIIKNSNGLFSFHPHSTREKIWLFNSDAVATELIV